MSPIYNKSAGQLIRDMINDLGVKQGDVFTKKQTLSWFQEKYPKIKDGTISAYLRKFSVNAPSRIHHNVHESGEDDLFYQVDGSRFRLYDKANDPAPIYKRTERDVPEESEPEEASPQISEFAYEKDLQNFLSKNLSLIEDGLRLYEEEDVTGIEFPVGSRSIDILAIDKNNNYVVIELKVSRGYDRVVGQILRYMAWIRKNQAEENQKVRGIIVAREISDDLLLACSEVDNVELFEYQLSVSLKKIERNE